MSQRVGFGATNASAKRAEYLARRVRDEQRQPMFLAFREGDDITEQSMFPPRQPQPGGGTPPWAGSGGTPVAITVEAEGVPADGEPVEFTDVVDQGVKRRVGVEWDGPDDGIVWPVSGTVQCYLEGRLDGPAGSGAVRVRLDGETVWESAAGDGSWSGFGPGATDVFPARSGQVFQLEVDADAGLEVVRFGVALIERDGAGEIVAPPDAPPYLEVLEGLQPVLWSVFRPTHEWFERPTSAWSWSGGFDAVDGPFAGETAGQRTSSTGYSTSGDPGSSTNNPTFRSLASWVKFPTDQGGTFIASRQNLQALSPPYVQVDWSVPEPGAGRLRLRYIEGSSRTDSIGTAIDFEHTFAYEGEWLQVGLVVDSDTARTEMYLNGALVGSDDFPIPDNALFTNNRWHLGYRTTGTSGSFSGSMPMSVYEIAAFLPALDPSDFAQLWASRGPLPLEPPGWASGP